jgi:serine/threonine protein kinase
MTAPSPPPKDVAPPTVEVFLNTVFRSGLMKEAELKAAYKAAPKDQRRDARKLADFLVRTGRLSRFQATKLLKGVCVGLVLGPYQVLAPIGKGGMGTVYMARDERTGRLAALKVLSPKKARDQARMVARFRREMELSRRVTHPHVALTYEAGQLRGVYFIAMEYIPGKTLYRLIADEGPLRTARAARLFAEAAAGLHHAHEQGLVHRDLKPSNLMVTPHDRVKVLDLGLALIQGEEIDDPAITGGRGYIVGSMDYIAPEQTADASKVDRRSDIYGLGCTLYYALTGQPPFPGGTNVDKIHCHRTEEPVPLVKLNPALPPEFAQIVRKMTAKDPARRYQTAREVEEDLRAWAAGEAVLPLDRPEDTEFLQAVAVLQAAEPSTEVSLTNLGIVDWKQATAAGGHGDGPDARRRRLLPLWLLGIAGVLAVLLVVELILLAVAAAGR